MELSSISPLGVLKRVLEDRGVSSVIYDGNKPTSGMPNDYINLYMNGGLSSRYSQMGMVSGYVLMSINVRLLSTGARNQKREGYILSQFDALFSDGRVVCADGYTFELDRDNMVYNGGGIYEGYSSKIINIKYRKEK